MLVRITHSRYEFIVQILIFIGAVLYTAYIGTKLNFEDIRDGVQHINWERNCYILGIIVIGIGLFLKYQHLPYAYAVLLTGIGVMFISYFLGMFSKNDDA